MKTALASLQSLNSVHFFASIYPVTVYVHRFTQLGYRRGIRGTANAAFRHADHSFLVQCARHGFAVVAERACESGWRPVFVLGRNAEARFLTSSHPSDPTQLCSQTRLIKPLNEIIKETNEIK